MKGFMKYRGIGMDENLNWHHKINTCNYKNQKQPQEVIYKKRFS